MQYSLAQECPTPNPKIHFINIEQLAGTGAIGEHFDTRLLQGGIAPNDPALAQNPY
jgi:hypothetical protein